MRDIFFRKLCYLFYFLPLVMASQGIQSDYTDITSRMNLASRNLSIPLENVLGSPYIKEQFQSVRVKNYESKIYSGRYNAYNNEMEIIVDSSNRPIALDIANNDYEVYFIVQNKTYRSFTYTTDRGVTKKGFLVVVSEKEAGVGLFKEEIVKFYDIVRASSSYDQDKPAKFKREDDNYYVKLKDGSITYLPTKSKDILKAFPQNEKEINDFIKKNKLKTKDEEDLIKVADFIGSL